MLDQAVFGMNMQYLKRNQFTSTLADRDAVRPRVKKLAVSSIATFSKPRSTFHTTTGGVSFLFSAAPLA